MTHGRSAYATYNREREFDQEGLADVYAPSGYFGLNLIKAVAYGWSKTTELARKGNREKESESPDNNADTLALFGSSKYCVSPKCSPTY
jgi:hypothetical protein